MDDTVLTVLLSVLVLLNCIAMLAVLFSKDLDRLQKTAQILMIWLLPVIGAIVVLILWMLRRAEPDGFSQDHLKGGEVFRQHGTDIPD